MIHAPGTPYWLIERRERVFLVLAGVFLCSMTLLNVILYGDAWSRFEFLYSRGNVAWQ